MPITKIMRGLPSDHLAAEDLMYHDDCLTECQRECTSRIGMTMQLEQEAYMTNHPENKKTVKHRKLRFVGSGNIQTAALEINTVKAMLELFIAKMTQQSKRKDILKEAGEYFTKSAEELDKDIRKRLGVPEKGPYIRADKPPFKYEDLELTNDLKRIILKYYPPEPWVIPTPHVSTPDTPSSSFLSIITSDTTLPTPEPIPTPEPTLSETFFALISNTVDKAIYLHVDDRALLYDTAYVELMKSIEQAMEIPVIEIREDIADLFYNAYKMFEVYIMEKERIAAELAWEKRMRKKLKRTLRRSNNFKGYETPPTPKSEISSHESYKKPPPPPCACHPQYHYNRYPKDRFGIYLPSETTFSDGNVTATPAISLENLVEETADDKVDTKPIMSKKSATSGKSSVSKKTTFKN